MNQKTSSLLVRTKIALYYSGGPTAFNYTCAKHRIALSLVDQGLSITLHVRNTELLCHWWSDVFQLHLCETQNCVVTGGATAFNYTCAKQICVVIGGATAFNYICAKHRIALSLVVQRLSITLVVRSILLRCHWWSNSLQLHLLCETQNLRCHWWSNGVQLQLLCEIQNCFVTGVAKVFNYDSYAKHRIALSLVEQRLSITLGVRRRELRCHCWRNGFQLHLLCETELRCYLCCDGFQSQLLCDAQNCVVTGGATAYNYTCLRKTELRCHWWSNCFQLQLYEKQNCVVTGWATAFNHTCCAKHRIALSLVEQRLSITIVVRSIELRCHWWSNGLQLHLC